MNAKQKVAAMIDACKNGLPIPDEAKFLAHKQPLNNLNKFNLNKTNSSLNLFNLVKEEPITKEKQTYPKLKRVELYTDFHYQKAMRWGVAEWLVHICVRDYGPHVVKGVIQRIANLPEIYFSQHQYTIDEQRGRLFNTEMKILRGQNGI